MIVLVACHFNIAYVKLFTSLLQASSGLEDVLRELFCDGILFNFTNIKMAQPFLDTEGCHDSFPSELRLV